MELLKSNLRAEAGFQLNLKFSPRSEQVARRQERRQPPLLGQCLSWLCGGHWALAFVPDLRASLIISGLDSPAQLLPEHGAPSAVAEQGASEDLQLQREEGKDLV